MQIRWDRSDGSPETLQSGVWKACWSAGVKGEIAHGHDLDGDLSNPIASPWSPSQPGLAIRADNVLQ